MLRALDVCRAFWRVFVTPAVFRRKEPTRAVLLRQAFEDLGGAWIKLGQMLALRFDLLPPAYCLELFKLLNEVRPFRYEAMRRTIEEDLGAPPEALFRSFEKEPFAAASIGQVHRAELHSGEAVAVKVQRPNVHTTIKRDIRLMYVGGWFVDRTRIFGSTRASDVIDEFARWTADELDYRTEARRAFTLREHAADDELEHDASVYLDLTSERVLTMEMIEGVALIDILRALRENDEASLEELERQGHDLDRIALHIAWNSFNQIYRHGYFHADLHPANLFVLEGDRIGYVDFGIVGAIPADVRESLVHYAWNLFRGNVDRAATEFMRWVVPSDRTDVVAARHELIRLLEEYLFALRKATTRGRETRRQMAVRTGADPTEREAASAFEADLMRLIREFGMSIQATVVTYFKAIVTANAVIFELSPRFDLQRVESRFFGSMILDDARNLASFRSLSSLLFDYSYRFTRALESIEQAGSLETFTTFVSRIRRQIVAMAVLALALAVVLLAPGLRSELRAAPWLYWTLVAIFALLVAGIFHQGRKLRPRIARLPEIGRGLERRPPPERPRS